MHPRITEGRFSSHGGTSINESTIVLSRTPTANRTRNRERERLFREEAPTHGHGETLRRRRGHGGF